MNSDLFHSLEGEKVYFKSLNIRDAGQVHSYASDGIVTRFTGWKLMKTIDQTREFIESMINRELAGTHLYASVALKSTHEIVGTIMFFNFDDASNRAEIGYIFNRDHWGKGYGTEAVAMATNFAFQDLKLHRVYACVVDVNVGSARILEKNGYELEGRLKEHYFIEGVYYDSLYYGKLNK